MVFNTDDTSGYKQHLYKAQFTFRGKNNDELTFNKGDMILVTQKLDGGWWEGTLKDKTAWFPSNYVAPADETDKKKVSEKKNKESGVNLDGSVSQRTSHYHKMVLNSLLDSEKKHVEDLQSLERNILQRIKTSNIISDTEFSTLTGNIYEIIKFQTNFLDTLQRISKFPLDEQLISKEFMSVAGELSSLYETYCRNHPDAVSIVHKYSNELSEVITKKEEYCSSDIRELTVNLSQPFRRLERYPIILKELERYMDEAHIDRGNTQRAITVYTDVVIKCEESRRLKELELELLSTPVSDWVDEERCKLSELQCAQNIHLVMDDEVDRHEALLLVYKQSCVILSVEKTTRTYLHKVTLLYSSLTLSTLPPSTQYKNTFQLCLEEPQPTSHTSKYLTISCTTPVDRIKVVDILLNLGVKKGVLLDEKNNRTSHVKSPSSLSSLSSSSSSSTTSSGAKLSPHSQDNHIDTAKRIPPSSHNSLPIALPTTSMNYVVSPLLPVTSSLPSALPSSHIAPPPVPPHKSHTDEDGSVMSCVRPSPPTSMRSRLEWTQSLTNHHDPSAPSLSTSLINKIRTPSTRRKYGNTVGRREENITYKKDPSARPEGDEYALVLKVVERYCTTTPSQTSGNVGLVETPQIMIPEDEKIICEDIRGGQTIVEERSLVDTVYTLQDDMKEIKKEISQLKQLVEEERVARKHLEGFVQKSLRCLIRSSLPPQTG